uniref:Major facilitator superfamily domain containing 4A n=1 Tax=Zonotrichia albicollis TaxID=44394 RepID=A0A8D2MNE7_ZONAL
MPLILSCLSLVPRLAQSLLALFASSLAISLVFAIIPLCHNVVVLAVVMAVAGLAMGCIDTISNMQLVKIYQKDSAIFLQVRAGSPTPLGSWLWHCGARMDFRRNFFPERVLGHWKDGITIPACGLGCLHYPLLAEAPECPRLVLGFFFFNSEMAFLCLVKNLLFWGRLAATQPQGDALLTFALHCSPAGHEDLFSCCQSKNFRGVSFTYFAVHITGALVLFMTDGIVGEYSGFVYSYAVEEPLAVVHKVAGYLPSLFWGFITLGRLISIPVSYRMKPATMVFINVVGVLVTFLLLLLFWSSVVFLFVGTASLGLFLSSAFPSLLAYTEDILQYQGCATTVLVTGAGIGEMVLQLLVGSIIHDRGSYSFLVCGMIFGCLAFTFYALLVFFHRMYPKVLSGLGKGIESPEGAGKGLESPEGAGQGLEGPEWAGKGN